MIRYAHSLTGIGPEHLQDFFQGWPNPPSPETHLKVLAQSDKVILAIDGESGMVVGFITALTDGVLCAYMPLLEVLPAYRKQGIGKELVRRLLARLDHFYMIDLLCDPELQSFYAQLGMEPATGMRIRTYDRQSGT